MGKFDSEFLEFRSLGQEILELNHDLAIAALYFPKLIEVPRLYVTVALTSDLLPQSSLGFYESYVFVIFIFFLDIFRVF